MPGQSDVARAREAELALRDLVARAEDDVARLEEKFVSVPDVLSDEHWDVMGDLCFREEDLARLRTAHALAADLRAKAAAERESSRWAIASRQ